ncbi:MAG: hypothetical protein K2N87_14790 [Eubacterium sp.]|nr:hypothetical protein [Eubacterium sp.]
MNSLKLKETMEQIHMPTDMQEEIIQNVGIKMQQRQHRANARKKALAAAAAFTLIAGSAIPIHAGIRYLVKDRLEQLPKQELEELNQLLQNQDNVEADRFSRAFTDSEYARMKRLEEAYTQGTFPKQQLARTDSSSQLPEDALCYAVDTGTYYLPARTLTDEELLQIIDFRYVTDYALDQGEAAQNALNAQKAEEDRRKDTIRQKGWLTEQEARKKADSYLYQEYGISGEELEPFVLLHEPAEEILTYHFSYQTEDDTTLYGYGIDLNAEDGSLVDTSEASLPKR